jgi:hypothetical protein
MYHFLYATYKYRPWKVQVHLRNVAYRSVQETNRAVQEHYRNVKKSYHNVKEPYRARSVPYRARGVLAQFRVGTCTIIFWDLKSCSLDVKKVNMNPQTYDVSPPPPPPQTVWWLPSIDRPYIFTPTLTFFIGIIYIYIYIWQFEIELGICIISDTG